jgi:hypothetical protein
MVVEKVGVALWEEWRIERRDEWREKAEEKCERLGLRNKCRRCGGAGHVRLRCKEGVGETCKRCVSIRKRHALRGLDVWEVGAWSEKV